MRNRFPRNCRIQLGSLENVVLLTGDRKFESISLQHRVRCELHPGSAPAIRFSGMSGYPPTRPADPRLAIRNIAYTAIPPPAGV